MSAPQPTFERQNCAGGRYPRFLPLPFPGATPDVSRSDPCLSLRNIAMDPTCASDPFFDPLSVGFGRVVLFIKPLLTPLGQWIIGIISLYVRSEIDRLLWNRQENPLQSFFAN
jgi:hypothetical protein